VSAFAEAADRLTGALARVLRLSDRALAPVARLWWLARLRAMTRGVAPVTTQFDGPARALPGTRLTLGAHCRLGRDVWFESGEAGGITLGEHVRVNTGTLIAGHAGVTIGDHALIGEYVSIRDTNHGTAPDALMRTQPQESAPIRIGNDVWLCRGCVVLKGVTIGDGAVVAANAVVTKDVPAGAIVAGIPARVVKWRIEPEDGAGAPQPKS
jgi:acetyltransferase-like isoleucine patch superfamily enzyme